MYLENYNVFNVERYLFSEIAKNRSLKAKPFNTHPFNPKNVIIFRKTIKFIINALSPFAYGEENVFFNPDKNDDSSFYTILINYELCVRNLRETQIQRVFSR
jgi:hypothetical protein